MRKVLAIFALAAALSLTCAGEAVHTVYLNSIAGVYPGCVVTGALPQTSTGGACTDSYAAIQGVLNTASASNPLVVVVESGYMISHGLTIPNGPNGGHVTIIGRGWDTGFIPAVGCNCSVLSNGYGYSPGTASAQSSSIEISDLTLNGIGNVGGNCGSSQCDPGHGAWYQSLQLYNVANVVIDHILTLRSPSFAVVIGNYSNVIVRNSYIAQAGGGAQNTDGIHFQGPGSNLEVFNDTIDSSGDDSLCLCAPEAMGGNISNSYIHDITLINAYDVLRIYTDCSNMTGCAAGGPWRVSKTTVRDVQGVVSAWAFFLDGDPIGTSYPVDNNDVLVVSNVKVGPTLTSFTGPWARINGTWGEVVFENCTWSAPTQSSPMMLIYGKVSHLSLLNDKILRNSTGSVVQAEAVQLYANTSGAVKHLTVADFEVVDSMTGTYSTIPALLDAQTGTSVGLLEVQDTLNANSLISALFTAGTAAQVTKTAGDLTGFPTTVAGLPAAATGTRAIVTDGSSPSFLGTITGGGSVVTPVFWNGTHWVAQ